MLAKNNDKMQFTIVMELAGTTSVSQVFAATAREALAKWNQKLGETNSYGLSSANATLLKEGLALLGSYALVEVDGLDNVWCATLLAGENLAMFHLVNTNPQKVATNETVSL